MSGKRHHILPKFLLKGFASRKKSGEIFTWVYCSKRKKIYDNNIKNVSVDTHFYGKEGELEADTEITNVERKYSVLIDDLRNKTYSSDVVEVEETLIPDFIAHLSIRTKHLRDSMHESTNIFLSEMEKSLHDSRNFSKLKKVILNKLKSEKPNSLVQLLLSEGSNFLDNKDSDIKKLFSDFIQTFKSQLPEAIRENHIKALAESTTPEVRANMYQGLRWFIFSSNNPFILGDTGCLFEINGSRKFKAFHDGTDKIQRVFLPIASHQILIGYDSKISKINTNAINEAIAKSSREFFICSEYSESYKNLLPLIGKESELIKQAEIQQIVTKNFNNL